MPESYAESINALAQAILSPTPESNHPLLTEQRLQIYRHHRRASVLGAMQEHYPTILTLVGDDFFAYLVDHYHAQFPSLCADLGRFGHCLGDFLNDFPPAQGLAYLADIARLEWAIHEVYHEADTMPFHPSRLSALAVHDYPQLRFVLNPALRLIRSDYPLLEIMTLCHPTQAHTTLKLDQKKGGDLLVFRPQFVVELLTLNAGEFEFLSLLSKQCDLQTAYLHSQAIDPDFELERMLKQAIANTLIVDF